MGNACATDADLPSLLAPMLQLLWNALSVLTLVWVLYRFLFQLPRVNESEDKQYLRGKTVWITGASSGIGKALAEYLRSIPNVRVILSSRSEASLQPVAESLRASGVKDVLVVPLDLVALASDFRLAQAAFARVPKEWGGVDILVHNGGCSMRGEVASVDLSVDRELIACNLLGAVSLTKAVLPSMIARGAGHIVAMSSIQGKLPIAFRSSYAASKHAMHGYFHSLRYEVASAGIQVHLICPGYVQTNISMNARDAKGGAYGKMDATTAAGYDPRYVAAMTYAAVRTGAVEVILAPLVPRAAMMLDALAPALLTWVMKKRTDKERKKMEAEEQKKE